MLSYFYNDKQNPDKEDSDPDCSDSPPHMYYYKSLYSLLNYKFNLIEYTVYHLMIENKYCMHLCHYRMDLYFLNVTHCYLI